MKYLPRVHDKWIGRGLMAALAVWHLLWFMAGALIF